MKYSFAIFKKDLYELTFKDIQDFFETEKEETLNLEFKSYPPQGDHKSKESAVIKAVCGFLNSEGGIVVWGAPMEVKNGAGNTTAAGELTPFETVLDKDRFINILSSKIAPMPLGIRVQQLKNEEGNSIFIIEVEKSVERPHQYDNLYFIRLDGQTRIAPHYIINALMKSVDFPIIRGHIRLKKIENEHGEYLLTFRMILFNTSQLNNDLNVGFTLSCTSGRIYTDNILRGHIYQNVINVLSHGAPSIGQFVIKVPANKINNDINLLFQFGGENSPSKISTYSYRINNLDLGHLSEDSQYLVEKLENKLPSDMSQKTDDEKINLLLNTEL